MFLAIAMIAFVGTSMAADVAEVEKNLFNVNDAKIELENSNLVAFTLWTRCDIIYMQVYGIAFEQFNNLEAANAIALSSAKTCKQLEAAPK
jgi:hypothetical protein